MRELGVARKHETALMPDYHLSDATIAKLLTGDLSVEARDIAKQHLDECGVCRDMVYEHRGSDREDSAAEVDRLRSSGRVAGMVPAARYASIIDRVFENVADESQQIEGERSSASGLLAELRPLAPSQRMLLVKNTPRYQNWGLVEELLAACRSAWSEDPNRAEELARLAIDITISINRVGLRERLVADTRGEAWSYIGNCRRIQFDLEGAESAFREAERCLETGTGDPMERARFLDLKSSYLMTAGRYRSAGDCLMAAIRGYRATGDRHLEGRAHLNYAKLLYDTGNVEQSVGVLDQASRLIDTVREPYLEFLLQWKKFLYLVELGRNEDASSLLPKVRELARTHAPRLERLRLLWSEGLLKKNLGHLELAEAALMQVREGYLAAEIASDVALVSLDLASLYLEIGRNEEVRRLAVETMPLFASRGVHREVLTAWSLFQRAAEQDAATLQLLNEVATQIRRTTDLQSDATSIDN